MSVEEVLDRIRHQAEAHRRHHRDAQTPASQLADFVRNSRQAIETEMTTCDFLEKVGALGRDEQPLLVAGKQGKSNLALEVGKAAAGAWLRDIEETGGAGQTSGRHHGMKDVDLMRTEPFDRARPPRRAGARRSDAHGGRAFSCRKGQVRIWHLALLSCRNAVRRRGHVAVRRGSHLAAPSFAARIYATSESWG